MDDLGQLVIAASMDTDVLVIGGGATGIGIARDCALRGLEVTLVERGGLSGGTSSRSHGLCHSGARYAEADAAGAKECIEERQILDDIAGECVRDTGGLFVQLPGDDPDYFDEKRDACLEVGIPVTDLEGEAARDLAPGLTPDVERALEVPDGVIYPTWLVAANAADAEDHGGSIYTQAPVESMTVFDGSITAVDVGGTVEETITPTVVVNAAGAWAGQVASMAGIEIEMQPNKGVMVAVDDPSLEPASLPVLNRCRPPADGDIVVPHTDEVVLGTTSTDIDDPDAFEISEHEIERVREECAAMVPTIAGAPERRRWWGVRPLYGPDEETRETIAVTDESGEPVESGVGEARGISRDFFLLDHAEPVPGSGPGGSGVDNFLTIVGGKLTTYRSMAEATTDHVCEILTVEAACETADRPLPGADDPAQLDAFAAAYDAGGPSDSDVVGPR